MFANIIILFCGALSISKKEEEYTVSTEATSNAVTKQYTYGDSTWKDLLTGFGELTYTYDEIGNVIRTENTRTEEVTEYSWSKGRRLEKIERGTEKTEYTYNRDGIRIGKSVQGGNVRYIVDGTKILKQIGTGAGKTLEFYYDAGGELVGFRYEGSDYYYGKNVQGDVTELYRNGVLIATYEYGAWGKLISLRDANGAAIADRMDSAHAAAVNPIRYRGYYYDAETGYYYLNSRYYNPEIGRFINADGYASTGQGLIGHNMFAYCGNNPVNLCDPSGNMGESVIGWLIGVASPLGSIAVGIGFIIAGGMIIEKVSSTYAPQKSVAIPVPEPEPAPVPRATPHPEEKKSEATGTISVTAAETNNSKKDPLVFPINPASFNPIGLTPVPRAGTSNGPLISWMDPITNTEVFRWDANTNMPNGPHYHIYGTGHYYPGMVVPEPYASIYFPGRE